MLILRRQLLLLILFVSMLFSLPLQLLHASDMPAIEISNISGVTGYQIGIFGAGFGQATGSVAILGAQAEIDEWTDTFIRVTVPDVADGTDPNGLVVTTEAGGVSSAEFTTYTINPDFLVGPATKFVNVGHAKPLTLDGVDLTFGQCTDSTTGLQVDVFTFLTNYNCRHDVGAKFAADSTLGTSSQLAINLEDPLDEGEYLLQFFSRADWSAATPKSCPGTGYPYAYTIESSRNGRRWSEPHVRVSDNLRGNRSHFFTLPKGTRWVRLNVTDSLADCRDDIAGRDFELKELRLFQVIGDRTQAANALAIYGDSITANAFNAHLGGSGLVARIVEDNVPNVPFVPFGLSGRKASQLSEQFADENELVDAFEQEDLAGVARYWGFALGTNDMNLTGVDDEGFTNPTSQFNEYDDALEVDAVQWLLDRGRVPILARMHDTNSAENGYGFLEAKIQLLHATDRLAAKYRLIPGPDMYTTFRLNIERDGGNWIADDGTHLANDGPDVWVELWAEALGKAFEQTVETPASPAPQAEQASPLAGITAAIEPRYIIVAIGVCLVLFGLLLMRRVR